MRYFEFIDRGIRKHFDWGYSEVFMPNPEDCFSPEEVDEVVVKLSALPLDSLSSKDIDLLRRLKEKKRKEKG